MVETSYFSEICPISEAIQQYSREWSELAREAIEPNPFLEDWFLSAIERSGVQACGQVVLVFRQTDAKRALVGIFPFTIKSRYKGLPVRVLSLFDSVFSSSGVPLVHLEHARPALKKFIDWSMSESGADLIEFPKLPLEGRFQSLLTEVLLEMELPHISEGAFARGLLQPSRAGSEAYLKEVFHGKRGQTLRARERKLRALGVLEYDALEPGAPAEKNPKRWLDDFLALEASGWKGKAGSAMACTPECRKLFELATQEAFARKKLMLSALRVDGRVVAMMVHFLAGSGAFVWKTSYDESLSACAPGLCLRVEHAKRVHEKDSPVQWIDSCSSPGTDHYKQIWIDQKIVQNHVVAARSKGRAVILLLAYWPMIRKIRDRLRINPSPGCPEKSFRPLRDSRAP